jgi:leucyl aminopeptidase
MIRSSPYPVKDSPLSARNTTARALLPAATRPALAAPVARLTGALLGQLDALLIFVPAEGAGEALSRLPHGEQLAARFARRARAPGSSFVAALPTARAATAVVGVVPEGAQPFALLGLAGRMVKQLDLQDVKTLGAMAAGCAPRLERACVEAGAAAALAAAFQLPQFKSKRPPGRRLARIVPVSARKPNAKRLAAVAEGTDLVRWLTSMPPDRLDPAGLRRAATALARGQGLSSRFYGEAELKRLGAGAFLAVTRGSPRRNAGILRLRYAPPGIRGRQRPVALVGKGLCFDTGGTNLKPHKGMLEMHTDMSGSAVALASLLTLARLKYPRPVEAWLALAENRIGPDAYQPQDIVTALDGTTIQVIHTDAEGRMVLADTLALVSRGRPAAIVDFATLTGGCVGALTERYSGAFTNRDDWRPAIERAGRDSGERVWCMPMDVDFDEEIESKVADVLQCPVDGKGDHIYASRFLQRFVGDGIPWLHVDLASATRHGGLAHVPTDVTGFGVRFLTALLLDAGLPE